MQQCRAEGFANDLERGDEHAYWAEVTQVGLENRASFPAVTASSAHGSCGRSRGWAEVKSGDAACRAEPESGSICHMFK